MNICPLSYPYTLPLLLYNLMWYYCLRRVLALWYFVVLWY